MQCILCIVLYYEIFYYFIIFILCKCTSLSPIEKKTVCNSGVFNAVLISLNQYQLGWYLLIIQAGVFIAAPQQ